MKSITLATKPEKGYELLDSGEEEKLERYGNIILARPDPQALWAKRLPESEWKRADAWYERKEKAGKWHVKKELPKEWSIDFGGLKFLIRPTSFKHTGIFPEQRGNWEWSTELVRNAGRPVSVLNLFAYTGGATLAAAKAGSEVTHLDASKTAVSWAKENAKLSGLSEKPIHWVVEDALKFVKREESRGNRYDAIIMDPPAFGHGPKDELWKIEENFLPLMRSSMKILSEKPLFFLINGYASGYSPLAFAHNLSPLVEKSDGEVEYGELTIEESKSHRLLPAGIFARWQKKV
ncbi:class I SAM-dependent methyltransferase [Candidatus Kaiserbacteria bacterium]|nr:class I SAM-dependent methyltransferase [Candidatus Kaiserbacteria bacterium]